MALVYGKSSPQDEDAMSDALFDLAVSLTSLRTGSSSTLMSFVQR
jgi:hypothetical protein